MTRGTIGTIHCHEAVMLRKLPVLLAWLSMLALPGMAQAAPVILAAYLNFAAGTITIEGSDLGTGLPTVTLAGQPLAVQQSSPTLIVAALPAGLGEGSYVLTVRSASGKLAARFEVSADRESTLTYAQASGGGPNPQPFVQFFAIPVSVTITNPSQRVLVTGFNAFGANSSGANALNLFICYQQQPGGAMTQVGNGMTGLAMSGNTRASHGMTRVLTLAPGTYLVGLCGNSSSSNWTFNDWGSTTALIFEPQ